MAAQSQIFPPDLADDPPPEGVIEIEKDQFPDGKTGYFAVVPEWEDRGAVAQGATRAEALKNIQEVLEMIVEEITEEGTKISRRVAQISHQPMVTVSL